MTERTALLPASEHTLSVMRRLVQTASGLYFNESRLSEFRAKCERTFAESGCASWEEYLARLQKAGGRTCLDHLVESLTVGETYFFRDRSAFAALEATVLPRIIEHREPRRQLRCWSAGCATGEEAYSLAIVLQRLLADRRDWQVSILATDLNWDSLKRAQEGLYGEWSLRDADGAFRATHFTREGALHRIRPEIANMVHFAHLNLADDSYPSPTNDTVGLDIIFCRNVLLYFQPDLASRVLARLRESLLPGGWLVLGPNDAPAECVSGLEAQHQSHTTFHRRVEATLAPQNPVAKRRPSTAEAASVSAAPWRRGIPEVELRAPTGKMPVSTEPRAIPQQAPKDSQHSGRPVVPALPAASQPMPDGDWRTPWRLARASADRGEMEEAHMHCRQAIECGDGHPEPYYLQGALFHALSEDTGALAAFRKALYVDPAFAPALMGLATIHRAARNWKAEQRALTRAQTLLAGRPNDELLLAEDGLTVGRLRDALDQMLGSNAGGAGR